MTQDPIREHPSQEAVTAFSEFLKRKEREPEASFDDYCRLRPTLAEDLGRLRDEWERATELFEALGQVPSLADRLKLTYGESIDLDISLSGDDGDSHASSGFAKRLATAGGGAYERRGVLARGGMGAILRIWDGDLRRTLAMKVVLGRDEEPDAEGTPRVSEHQLARFLEEAQITGQLDHPGIVPVHDLGIDEDGRVYFTMPLVRGETLKDIFDHVAAGEEGWTTTRALGVLVKVCEAMAFAHSKGVIHRDLKPANVMVGRFGETYVMDWGLAKVLGRKQARRARRTADIGSSMSLVHTDRREASSSDGGSALETMDGDVVGTPAYMAPEQARGHLDEIGPHSDVYSVGSMLYQLLAGFAPYHSPGVKMSLHTVLARVLDGPPTPVEQIDKKIPPELAAICNKAMAREPRDRYSGMLELAEDLRAFVEGHVVRAYETGAMAEFKKWVTRNGVAAAFIAASIVIAIVGLSTVILQQSRSRTRLEEQFEALRIAKDDTEAQRDRAEANEREADRLRGAAQEMADRARRQSYLGNVRAADSSLELLRTSEANEMLATCEEDLRGWEWQYLSRRADSAERVFHVPTVLNSASLTEGGRFVLVCSAEKIRLWDPETEDVIGGFADPQLKSYPPAYALMSPDKTRIVSFHVGGRVWVWDSVTHALIENHYAHQPYAVFGLAKSVDGLLFATCGQDRTVVLWSTITVQPLLTILNRVMPDALAIAPDAKSLAVGYRDGTTRLWSLLEQDDEGRPKLLLELSGHAKTVRGLAFSPDGTQLLSGSFDGTARLWDTSTGETLTVLGGHELPVTAVAYHPDGERVATGSEDDTVRLWDVATGRQLDVLLGHTGTIRSLEFHPEGDRLLSAGADDAVRIWRLDRNPLHRVISAHDRDVEAIALSPDGRRLATSSAEGEIRLWNTTTGRPLDTLAGHSEAVTSIAYDATGKRIVTGSADRSVRIWDADTSRSRGVLSGHSGRVLAVATSPDGALVASAGEDRQIRLWDIDTRASRALLAGHQGAVHSVAFGPSSARLVSGSADGTLRVWELESGRYQILQGHERDVLAVAFSPDGRTVASGGKDTTVRLWDARTGELRATLDGHDDDVVSVAFDAAGSRLVSASSDGTMRVWDPALGAQLLAVELRVPLRCLAVAAGHLAAAGTSHDETGTHGDVWLFEPQTP